MFERKTKLRVRYSETDRMGYVYYGNYAQYFEVGRVEALRALGLAYRKMEEDGIMLPVLKMDILYIKPAFYDDELTITSRIEKTPTSKIEFHHEVHNQNGELLNQAKVILVSVNSISKKPMKLPSSFIDTLQNHWVV
jgi:acyl-CoA thioester hydrolase